MFAMLWYKKLMLLWVALALLLSGMNVSAKDLFPASSTWQSINPASLVTPWPRTLDGVDGSYWRMDMAEMQSRLLHAPSQRVHAWAEPVLIELPLPDGRLERFWVRAAPTLLEGDLAGMWRTYTGGSLEDEYTELRLMLAPSGVTALITGEWGAYRVQPLFQGDPEIYISYKIP